MNGIVGLAEMNALLVRYGYRNEKEVEMTTQKFQKAAMTSPLESQSDDDFSTSPARIFSDVDLSEWTVGVVIDRGRNSLFLKRDDFTIFVHPTDFHVNSRTRGTLAESVATIEEALALCQ